MTNRKIADAIILSKNSLKIRIPDIAVANGAEGSEGWDYPRFKYI